MMLAACGSSSSDSPSSSLGESTTDVSTVIDASSTTSVVETSTTAVGATSTTFAEATTVPVGASITLRPDGVGDALFGAEPEGVIAYLRGLLGPPSTDSGWVSAVQRTCPGTEVRNVTWGDLALLFGDQSNVSTLRRHFFAWSYGPPAGEVIAPFGLVTAAPALIGIGSTVSQLRAAYPSAVIFAGDELVGPWAKISEGLVAYLTNTGPAGVVTSFVGGTGCGE